MPAASAQPFVHQMPIDSRFRSFLPSVPPLVASVTSGHDVVCLIATTVLPCKQVLSGAAKVRCLRRADIVVSAEGFEIVFPHWQAAVVAAADLGEVCVVTKLG